MLGTKRSRAKLAVTCFTDIKGYTERVTNAHKPTQEIIDDHLRVGQILVDLNGGQYIKNVGDAHMATFDELESALLFATQFQQYYKDRPCLKREPLLIRVALYLGVVEPKNNDVFGPGVIGASRVEGVAEATRITVNKDLRDDVGKLWGGKETKKFFTSIGEHKLKGFDKKEVLFTFDWNLYSTAHPAETLPGLVYNCFESAGIEQKNLSVQDLALSGDIIWPVVPRSIVTAIHRGQIEMIRVLTFLGWKIRLLIADCGTAPNINQVSDSFQGNILAYAGNCGLQNIEPKRLSFYFNSSEYENQKDVIDQFKQITSDLNVDDLRKINMKNYAEEVWKEIQRSPTLDFLRPVLTCAAVLHLAKTLGSNKIIVIAGNDEDTQWRHAIRLESDRLGAILNPILKERKKRGEAHTARQKDNWPIWQSKEELTEDIKKTNAGKWVFQLFAQLPAFPSLEIPENELGKHGAIRAKDWTDEYKIYKGLDTQKLIAAVWPKLNPAIR